MVDNYHVNKTFSVAVSAINLIYMIYCLRCNKVQWKKRSQKSTYGKKNVLIGCGLLLQLFGSKSCKAKHAFPLYAIFLVGPIST